jgi:transposase
LNLINIHNAEARTYLNFEMSLSELQYSPSGSPIQQDTPIPAPDLTPVPHPVNGQQTPTPAFNNATFVPKSAGASAAATRTDLSKLRDLATRLQEKRQSKKGELPPETRIAIITAVACGVSRTAVAEIFGISQHTVRVAIDRWEQGFTTSSRPRSGRPRKLTDEDEGRIKALAQSGQNLKQLATLYGVSKGTIRRVVGKKSSGDKPAPAPAPQPAVTPVPPPPGFGGGMAGQMPLPGPMI